MRPGVIHRDIKPTNFMLLPDGTVKLMDFGLARQEDDTIVTQADMMVGSPSYMAPSRSTAMPRALAADIWALGVLLYEMLAGHPPFTGTGIPSVLYQVTHEPPAAVTGLASPVLRSCAAPWTRTHSADIPPPSPSPMACAPPCRSPAPGLVWRRPRSVCADHGSPC